MKAEGENRNEPKQRKREKRRWRERKEKVEREREKKRWREEIRIMMRKSDGKKDFPASKLSTSLINHFSRSDLPTDPVDSVHVDSLLVQVLELHRCMNVYKKA